MFCKESRGGVIAENEEPGVGVCETGQAGVHRALRGQSGFGEGRIRAEVVSWKSHFWRKSPKAKE